MSNRPTLIAGAAVSLFTLFAAAPQASAQWVNFANESSTRLVATPLESGLTTANDTQEKDFAWGDVDHDGDIDLVSVRKQPLTTTGRKINCLFMNEGIAQGHAINGVLVDRAAQYAQAVDLNGDGITDLQPAGDLGFKTATNDRDVVLADVNNDGWLDIVTAPTLSDNLGKVIGHPRIYMNLKEVRGVWQGFRFEPNRTPDMAPPGAPGQQPRFCSVAAGDVTGDGYVDLYFGDYDRSTGGMNETFDYNNKLLINAGASNPGFFTDSGNTRMSTNPGLVSAFGAASIIIDMNNDGALDVVKQTSLASPTHVAIQYNNPGTVGTFIAPERYDVVNDSSPYFVSAGDLNNDGRMDLIVTDDGQDVYMLNTGNAADGTANFSSHSFGTPSSGFGSQSVAADLNNDGWRDVLISDFDVDSDTCGDGGRLHIYRNLGGPPTVTIQEQPVDGLGNVAATMGSTFNVAVFDINNDGWNDLVLGRCTGNFVWMGVPPVGISFTYPGGLPGYISPNQATNFNVQLNGISGATITPGTGKIFTSIDGAPFVQSNMTPLGGNLYSATLPAVPCTSRVRFYVTGDYTIPPPGSGGGTKSDPPNAPAQSYLALSAIGTQITLDDTIEGSIAGWTISDGPGLTAGTWEQADPNTTFFNGVMAAPADDATGGEANIKAFVTLNDPTANETPGNSDIDGGTTYLMSPAIDLAGADATITYSRWFFSSAAVGNALTTQVSNNNGASWVDVESVGTTMGDGGQTVWQTASFIVGQYVTPSAQVRVRFAANGAAAGSVAEAGIDNFIVQEVLCTQPCLADITGDNSVTINDLLAVINSWGPCANPNDCPADISPAGPPVGDDIVNINDLLDVINSWGSCP